jgi:beta-glucuronidase
MKRIGLLAIMAFTIWMAQAQDITLNGEWQFTVDNQKWQTVTVPHTYNIMEGLEDYAGEAVYKRSLPITADMKNKTVRLHFEAVYHDAIVFINGKKVGEHLNKGYTPFSFDITKWLDFSKENTLEVHTSNAYTDKALPYKRHFDWSNDGGIYRNVWLHISGKQTIRYVHATPSLDGKTRFDVRLWNDKINKLSGQLTIINHQTGEKVYDNSVALSKRKGDKHFSTTIKIENPQLWHFDHPNLYDFTFTIPDSDTLSDHFGIREFKVVGKRFVLNGEEMPSRFSVPMAQA